MYFCIKTSSNRFNMTSFDVFKHQGRRMRKGSPGSSLVVQCVKDPVWLWLLLRHGFKPWPRNCCMSQAWPKILLINQGHLHSSPKHSFPLTR